MKIFVEIIKVLVPSLFITIILHELGHLIAALWCKLKVKYFSIGLGKPYIFKKWLGINWRITPWLIGGEVNIEGDYEPNKGFFALEYKQQVLISLAGVFVNLILAFICYLILYKSIWLGLKIDFLAWKAIIIKDYTVLFPYIEYMKEEYIYKLLWNISLMNISAFCLNSLPFPALDGGMLVLLKLKNIYPKNYSKIIKISSKIGFWLLIGLQLLFIKFLWLS